VVNTSPTRYTFPAPWAADARGAATRPPANEPRKARRVVTG
jgi:hypothetical protein